MPHIKAQDAVVFEIPNATFSGLAAPSRGSRENAVWRLTLAPNAPGVRHSLSREEVLIAVTGQAVARIGEVEHHIAAGDAVVVPAETSFELSNPGAAPFVAIAVLPVGAVARMGTEPAFVPPWAV
jgi:mannose-6-phosphate isomerase-like protein (cupin superfamily)